MTEQNGPLPSPHFQTNSLTTISHSPASPADSEETQPVPSHLRRPRDPSSTGSEETSEETKPYNLRVSTANSFQPRRGLLFGTSACKTLQGLKTTDQDTKDLIQDALGSLEAIRARGQRVQTDLHIKFHHTIALVKKWNKKDDAKVRAALRRLNQQLEAIMASSRE